MLHYFGNLTGEFYIKLRSLSERIHFAGFFCCLFLEKVMSMVEICNCYN